MVSELDKMLAGELYDPMEPELVRARVRARDLCQDLNATREAQIDERRELLKQLFGKGGETVWMQPPFFCDYGSNILLGERVFFNFNCVVLDVCRVTIGDFTQFGPAVQIYTATHPMNADLRRKQEFAKPIKIGSDVWLGDGAIICPGVRIGSRSVIVRAKGTRLNCTVSVIAQWTDVVARAGTSNRPLISSRLPLSPPLWDIVARLTDHSKIVNPSCVK